ncbi:MAG: 3',5'-cyclic-nucleotide phosphodiesterase [Acidobacteria bacterium]|nr:MAG: 3',5'-cyclic-nucleotide phosphodiesterase [Acidobacteriota bacterium]
MGNGASGSFFYPSPCLPPSPSLHLFETVKIKLLPSTIAADGLTSPEQRLSCFVVDGRVAIDAGSIAIGLTDAERETVRDVIITHPHMDHVATLPIYVDDLFGFLNEPVRIHATEEVCRLIVRDVFNGTVYPPFQDFDNGRTRVMEFVPFRVGDEFRVAHLSVTAVPVRHIVPTVGMVFTDGETTVAFSSDTASTEEFWQLVNRTPRIAALLIESSFPNFLSKLAETSGHLTPEALGRELRKLRHTDLDILAMHLKPSFRLQLVRELAALGLPRLSAMEPGREYSW